MRQAVSILNNAVAAIQIGVDDFRSQDPRRILSAIRNVYAGVLLLAKAHLARLSPAGSNEALIKARVRLVKDADGRLSVNGVGRKTVDVQQIKERFADLGITFDWKPLDTIHDIRNNIEHYYIEGSHEQLRAAMHDAQVLVHRLVVGVLHEEPSQLLGQECWDVLLQESEIFEAAAQACSATLREVDWTTERAVTASENLICPACGVNMLVRQLGNPTRVQVDLQLGCDACGGKFDFQDCLAQTLNNEYFAAAHFGALDGEEPPVQRCPECRGDTYVIEDQQCAFCEFSMPEDTACHVCHQPLSLEDYEDFGTLCSYHANQLAKDD